ncbi:MAG: hypothetical protein U5J64_06115 [Halobacteriales archaeon]|nr:hypothetical protein [Halobacteriales archaeon]
MNEQSVEMSGSILENIRAGLIITIYHYIFQLIVTGTADVHSSDMTLSIDIVLDMMVIFYFVAGFLLPIVGLRVFRGWWAVGVYLVAWFTLMIYLPSEIFTINFTFQVISILLVAIPDLLKRKSRNKRNRPPLR